MSELELIEIHQVMFGEEKVNATDSRELYKKLGLAKGQYKRWIETYINDYDFESGFDYVEVDMNVEVNPLSRAKSTIVVSTDMAKEICMMTNNEIGSKIRKYYISLERRICDTSKIQLDTAQKEIKELQVKRMRTYRHGFMSLRKYIKDSGIIITEDTAWSMLSKFNIIESRDVTVSKKFLADDSFGRQNGDSVIEFNSRSLDLIFRDYVYIEPTLF